MKVKIFLSTFGLSIFWLANFLIKEYYDNFFFNQYVALGLFLGSLLRIVISKRFLISLTVDNNSIAIEYYNQLISKKKLTFPLSEIVNTSYVKKNWFLDEFDKFKIEKPKDVLTFQLLNKNIKEKIKSDFPILKMESIKA